MHTRITYLLILHTFHMGTLFNLCKLLVARTVLHFVLFAAAISPFTFRCVCYTEYGRAGVEGGPGSIQGPPTSKECDRRTVSRRTVSRRTVSRRSNFLTSLAQDSLTDSTTHSQTRLTPCCPSPAVPSIFWHKKERHLHVVTQAGASYRYVYSLSVGLLQRKLQLLWPLQILTR